MGSLQGKVIVVTGAASGIGLATSLQAAERGASLALADVSVDALTKVVDNLKAKGVNVTGTKVDVSDSKSVDAWIASTMNHFGRIDGAANIAGVEGKGGPEGVFNNITNITDETFDWIIGINLKGLFYSLRAELRAMERGASIVNISSLAGLRGRSGLGAYVASKHGVLGLTKTAAKEEGERGIRVNAVCPGPVTTPMMERLLADGKTKPASGVTTATYTSLPLKRTAEGEEIAKAICFLLSDESSYMTGVAMPVDGGAAC